MTSPLFSLLFIAGKGDKKAHSESGFEDFYDFSLLKSHQHMHVISMEEFLEKEALTGEDSA